jgi:hypothetical protein
MICRSLTGHIPPKVTGDPGERRSGESEAVGAFSARLVRNIIYFS